MRTRQRRGTDLWWPMAARAAMLALGPVGGALVATGATGFHGLDWDSSLIVIAFRWVCLPVTVAALLFSLVRRSWKNVLAAPFVGIAAYAITVVGGALGSIAVGRREHDGFPNVLVMYLIVFVLSAHMAWYVYDEVGNPSD